LMDDGLVEQAGHGLYMAIHPDERETQEADESGERGESGESSSEGESATEGEGTVEGATSAAGEKTDIEQTDTSENPDGFLTADFENVDMDKIVRALTDASGTDSAQPGG